ncbi:MAG: dTDP-4-dehydrorhamnose 3,5-epimerase family protein [Caldisphaera sp.]
MKVEELGLDGVKLIKNDVFQDKRGYLFKPYSYDQLFENGINMEIKEVLFTTSKKNVIRGMHFQMPPSDQSKIVTVMRGKIIDVLLDIKRGSLSFGKYVTLKLEANDGKAIFMPGGIAHGFLSLANGTQVLYLMDSPYSPSDESGIRYDSFGYVWGVQNPIISNRDLAFKPFNQFESPFK